MATYGGLGGLGGLRDEDFDLIARTIIGEAGNQPLEGQQGIANVVMNRLNSGRYGATVPDVLFAPRQFTPWNTRRGELMSIPTTDPRYQQALDIAKTVGRGMVPDVTGGATHFANPAASDPVNQRGWIAEMQRKGGVRIGAHVFGSPDSAPGAIRPAGVQFAETPEDVARLELQTGMRSGGAGEIVAKAGDGEPPAVASRRVRVASADPTFVPSDASSAATGDTGAVVPDTPGRGGLGGLGGWTGVAGNLLSAVGASLLSSPRDAPLSGVPAALQGQLEARGKEEDRRIRQMMLQNTLRNTAADNARADAMLKISQAQLEEARLTPAAKAARDMGLTPGTPGYLEFLKQQYKPGNKFGVIGEDEYGNKRYGWINENSGTVTPWGATGGAPATSAPTAPVAPVTPGEPLPDTVRPPPPGVDPKAWRAKETERLAEREKPLPGELAGRVALGEVFLRRAPGIREKLAAGDITGPWDALMAHLGKGEQGKLRADIETGVDALRRGLTGAGMNLAEADEYARRYLPQVGDRVGDVLNKHDRLVEELSAIRGKVYEGRKMPPLGGAAPAPTAPARRMRFDENGNPIP